MKNEKYNFKQDIVYYCQYHVFWCTKYNRKVLNDEIRTRLESIIKSVLTELNVEVKSMLINTYSVYLCINVEPLLGPHKTIKRIKSNSSSILRKEYPELSKKLPTLWSNSYFISTDIYKPELDIEEYVRNQKTSERK